MKNVNDSQAFLYYFTQVFLHCFHTFSYAYLLLLSRLPNEEERRLGRELLSGEPGRLLVNYCHLLLGLNEFIYVN